MQLINRKSGWYAVLLLTLGARIGVLGQPTANHQSGTVYPPGGTLTITNNVSYSGPLWSLLWRPQLPNGWTLGSVSGDGNPELSGGEILWTGPLPPSPIRMIYTLFVPAGAAGARQIRGEVEYQLAGMVNPATRFADPNPLTVEAQEVPPLGTVQASHQTSAQYVAGAALHVTNTLTFTNALWSLLWRPRLPGGWTLGTVSGDGNPELSGGEIVWTGALPPSPIRMTYTVQVPAGAAGSQQIQGDVEYQLAATVNPVTVLANPNPLIIVSQGSLPVGTVQASHLSATQYVAGATLSVTNTLTFTNALWSLLWRPRLPGGWSLLSVSGDGNPELSGGEIVWTGALPPSPIQMIYQVLVPYGTTGDQQLQGEVENQLAGMVNPVATLANPNPMIVTAQGSAPGGTIQASHLSATQYVAGATLSVTNTLTFTNALWSLLWRPRLPGGWSLLSVSGDGNPELSGGEILWTGTLPPSPIRMVYTAQAPAGATGTQQIRGEVEYQLAGMVNPATQYANPNPLEVINAPSGLGPTITAQPQSQTVAAGTNVSFNVTATGTAPLRYQWQFNGSSLAGATNAAVSLNTVSTNQAGSYRVVVSNMSGSITSQVAVLIVNQPTPIAGGIVVAWGQNLWGQLNVPASLSNVVSIAAGRLHSLALKGDGTIVGWGENSYGQASPPASLSNVVAIAAGRFHSLALKKDGTVAVWGDNGYGQTNLPSGLTNTVAIAAGSFHSVALKRDGTVVCWGGDNTYGQTNLPTGLSNVVGITAGVYFSLALKADGQVVGWGYSSWGETNPPPSLNNAVAIAAGANHSMALKGDGTVVCWGYNANGQTNAPASLSNVVAIAAGFNHNLALKRDGTVVGWGYNQFGQCDPPAGLSNVVAIAAGGTHSLALQTATLNLGQAAGTKRWEFATGHEVNSSPAIGADGTIYVGCRLGVFYALDGATGVKRWEFPTGNHANTSPAIGANGTVYIGSQDRKVYALDGATGQKRWEFVTGGEVNSSPAIGVDGTVYVGSLDYKVYALDGATGAKRWEFLTGGQVHSSPAIGADGTVYVGCYDNNIYALDGVTGQKRWMFATGRYVWCPPTIGVDGTVYVGSHDYNVYALNGATGQKRWMFATGSYVGSAPAIGADGTVYVGSDDHKLYALDGASGQKKWEFTAGNNVSCAPTIGPDGTVYVGSLDGKVYALYSGSTGGPANSPWPMFHQNARHTGRVPTSTVVGAALRVALFGTNVVLSWPASATGFQLESAANLIPPLNWTAVATPPTVSGGQNQVTENRSPASKFYRLRRAP